MAQHMTLEQLCILVTREKAIFKDLNDTLAKIEQSDPNTLSDADRNSVFNWDKSVVKGYNRQLSLLEEKPKAERTSEERTIMQKLNELIVLEDHITEKKNLVYTAINDRKNAMKKGKAAKPASGNDVEASRTPTTPLPDTTNAATPTDTTAPPLMSDNDASIAEAVDGEHIAEAKIVDPKQLYQILKVEPDTTLEEIKKAAKKATLRLHPDRVPDDPTAASRFADFQAACQVFQSEERRREFDDTGDVKAIEDLHLRLEGLLLESGRGE